MRKILLLSLLVFGNAQAGILDSVSLDIGNGNSVNTVGVNVRTKEFKTWYLENRTPITLSFMTGVSYWKGYENDSKNSSLIDLNLTPLIKWQFHKRFYIEGGLGMHLLSKTKINSERNFSTAFQFGEHVGVGMKFGSRNQCDLGLQIQHISNGSIKQPNNGITFGKVIFQYHF